MTALTQRNIREVNLISLSDDYSDENKQKTMLTQNAKINRLIEEINANYTRKQIAILFLEVSERPEICTDFNLSVPFYLNKYMLCREDFSLSEIGVFILCAAKIYSRRIDFIFDGIQRMLAGIEKSSMEIENGNKNNKNGTENKTTDQPKPLKRPPKRSLPKDDSLYESEIEPKIIKKAFEDKICDNKFAVNTFEPPKTYFRNFKKYLEYRANNKKVKKSDSKHNENADPSLYKYSTIEDFDYEDDIDSKRNYKTLHGHIEHRYSTIVSDINFLLHFKVKDFVEQELEEIEKLNSMGLPPSPKRKWYSLCHNEYVNGLLQLENEVLKKEFDTNIDVNKKRRKLSFCNIQLSSSDKIKMDQSLINGELFDSSGNKTLTAEETNVDKVVAKSTLEPPENALDESLKIQNLKTESQEVDGKIVDDIHFEDQYSVNRELENSEQMHDDVEIIDPQKIIVRLSSEDEGIFLSDLDDIQSAMLSPKVLAIDIRKSIDHSLDYFTINLDKNLEDFLGLKEFEEAEEEEEELRCSLNILGISKELLSFKENFSLPIDLLVNETPITINMLKLPETKIRASKNFSLPEEYNIYKADRCKKRIPLVKPPRNTKLLNSPERNCSTPSSLSGDSDFLGFSKDEIVSSTTQEEKNDNDRHRLISTDSGIVMSKLCNLNTNTTATESEISQSNILSSTMVGKGSELDSGFFNSADLSDVNNLGDSMSISQNLEQLDDSAKVIDVQTIVPALTQNEKTSSLPTNDNDFVFDSGCIDEDEGIDDFNEKDDCIESIKVTEKIKEWHKHLKPILSKSKSRHHFDVFNLGTEIMNKFSAANNNNTINFSTVMEEKDPSFTSRYFLSMLLLANTNNIKLNIKNKNTELPSLAEDIEIVLLSTKRHTVSVEDNIGLVNAKQRVIEEENVVSKVPYFPKPNKVVKKSSGHDDNDSGFFSNASSISYNESR